MTGYIDKVENVAVVMPTSPAEFASFCRAVTQELKPTRGVRPKCVPLSTAHIEEICHGLNINQQILGGNK